MDIGKINDCLAFFHAWANAKNDPGLFASLEVQREPVTADLFNEILDNPQVYSWLKHRYHLNDPKEFLSVIGITVATLVERAQEKLYFFENATRFKGYLAITMRGKSVETVVELKNSPDILTDKIRAEDLKEMKEKNLISADAEFDNIPGALFDAEANDEAQNDSIGYENDDDRKAGKRILSIEEFADPEEAERQEWATLRTDIKALNRTLVYILSLVYKDLNTELEILEKKLAWQMGLDPQTFLKYQVGFHNDHILAKYDAAPLIRYMHWQNLWSK